MLKNVIKKISAVAMAFTLLGTGTAVANTFSPMSYNTLTANAASYGDKILAAAKADIGKKRSEVGCGGTGDWCALYATNKVKAAEVDLSYCYDTNYCTELVCDFIQKGIYHSKQKTSYESTRSHRRVNSGTAYDANYVPKPGDLIFYDWTYDNDDEPDHVGIVNYVQGDIVYTIEGNNGNDRNRVTTDWWHLDRPQIHGYASFDGNSSTSTSSNSPRTGYTSSQIIGPVEFKGISYPITLPAGGSFNVYGTLKTKDNSNIQMVKVDIDENRNGTYYNVDRTVRYPNTKSYDLHTIDDRIWFNRASKKNTTYRYRIIVVVNGKEWIHTKYFTTY